MTPRESPVRLCSPLRARYVRSAAARRHASASARDRRQSKPWRRDVIPAFLKTNVATLGAITALAILDEVNIAWDWIAAGDRIISAQVIIALLGATTVQVGAIAAIIARYLFPGRPP